MGLFGILLGLALLIWLALRGSVAGLPEAVPLAPPLQQTRLYAQSLPCTIRSDRGPRQNDVSIHPHMLRHGCGYTLANAGHDTRALQAWLGHKNIQHTMRYTELAPDRFKNFWR